MARARVAAVGVPTAIALPITRNHLYASADAWLKGDVQVE
jgi:hypothetical protein